MGKLAPDRSCYKNASSDGKLLAITMSVMTLVGALTLAGCVGIATSRTSSAITGPVTSSTGPATPAAAPSGMPTLPQATVDLTMPTQTGTVWNVPAGDAATLQSDINSANCGDTIVLVAGSTYTGNFTIPNKSCTGWIIIQSSKISQLPSGSRVGPSNVLNMATINTTTTGMPAIQFQASSHNWRLIGLEVTTTIGMMQYSLIETDVGATSQLQLPSYIIVDRCYIHADLTAAVRRGLSFQVAYGGVVDSYFSEFHQRGTDSQAIAVWKGTGPFLIQNNFLSAASENVIFGGSDPGITNLVPSDVTIVGNHFWKNYSAWNGAGLNVKNLLEFKNVQRVLVDGNVIEYSWADAQVGFAILLTPRNQSGGCDWCVVQDVTIKHNLIQHAGNGIETAPSDNNFVSLPTDRVLIQNNVLTDISSVNWNGDGRVFETLSTINSAKQTTENNITIDHNSGFADKEFLLFGDSGTIPSYQFTNNLGSYGAYGIIGNGTGIGSASLNAYAPNAIYNDVAMLTSGGGSDGNPWPSRTFWNSVSGAQFTNYPGGNYQLLSTSPYHSAGTDGKDIGVWDWNTFNTETTNALSGNFPY
jgi:hypothetical protein